MKKELKRFLVAGMSAVGTDLATYYLLLNFLNTDSAKAISFFLGTIVAFIINKYWTFEKHDKSYIEIMKFGALYSLTLGVNVITNKIILDNFSITILAFLIATGVSTVLNFIGQKWWVFR
jgi:putative flippase GtrA